MCYSVSDMVAGGQIVSAMVKKLGDPCRKVASKFGYLLHVDLTSVQPA